MTSREWAGWRAEPMSGGFVVFCQIVAALLCAVDPVSALDPTKAVTQYSHSVWQTEEGLPQNTVRAVAQTPDGYLWVGTEAGLARFDGVRFRIYDRRSDGEIFENQHIYALALDPRGPLWVGTNGGGLIRYEDGAFQRFGTADGLPVGRVTALAVGKDGDLWIGTYGGGLARLRDGVVDAVFDHRHGLAHPVIFDVEIDAEDVLWVATYGGGLHRLREGRFEVIDRQAGLASDHVWAVHAGRDGDLWVGTDVGLHRLREGRVEIFTTAEGLPHDRVISLLEDIDGNLWIGTYGGGLARWIDGSISRLSRGMGQWTSDNVWTLFEDREGTVWAGTLGGGLHQLKDGPFTTYSRVEGMSSEIVSGLFEDRSANLWLTTRGGLHRFQDRAFDVWGPDDGLASLSSWAVFEDRRGALWVGHSGSGVDRRLDGVWKSFTTRDGLADDTVFDFAEDQRGDLWIATNAGLSRFRDGSWTTYTQVDGLAGDQIRCLLVDRRQRLWIGTTRGLSRFDGDELVTVTIEDGLSVGNIEDLWEDDEGTLWVATRGSGLKSWRDGEIVAFSSRDGLLDDDLSGVTEDEQGHLWLSTSRGIFRVAKSDLAAFAEGRAEKIDGVTYGRRDGLKSEIGYGGGLRTKDGRLWFGTLDGVAVVDPSRLEHIPAPTVLIEQVTADGVVLPPQPEPLGPGVRRLDVRFTAPTLLVPGKIELRYRLRGFDESWQVADGRRTVSYGNLRPERYTFEVMASDELGRWNGEVTSFSLRILPTFYQKASFYALCGLAAVLLGFGVNQFRILHLQRRAKRLSLQVDEALARLKVLKGLLPICASCKRIRDDKGHWTALEVFIDERSEASFSHGVCPQCLSNYRESMRARDA